MKPTKQRRLELRRETVRLLQQSDLTAVQGGGHTDNCCGGGGTRQGQQVGCSRDCLSAG
jgi:hypothetical protein